MHDSFSGSTAYALGRMSAQSDRDLQDFGRALQRRFRPPAPTVDVNALMTENQILQAELARVSQALRDYEWNYSKLRSWADAAEAELQALRAKGS
ncbi:MAG: hypothetical protein EOO40_03180 [Deltaproteobacteria bacterium]|nr:MAG: hypothetical protein EOO40_03180 [Deltaproteobacteria bacterium]